ncbi:MAG: aminoacyl-histidine dipeptidase [Bacteroidales bacterium]
MSEEIRKLEPKSLWEFFYQLTQIPRPSKHEAAAMEFIKNFGKTHGLETIQDEVGNIVIRKPATPGYENRKGVIFQGHLDMVPQANSDSTHDFTKDPIDAHIDGEWVKAKGTTLGSDNGIGVAAALAVLSSKDLVHGPLEGLFTIDEETGMTGAFGIKPGLLKGDILMNLDSEDEGELYVGCAGGIDGSFYFKMEKEPVPSGYKAFELVLKGLKGGHSGVDIHLGRGNANKIMVRFIKQTSKNIDIRVATINGGNLRNAIPREAFATILIPVGKEAEFNNVIKEYTATIKKEFSSVEPDFNLQAKETNAPQHILSLSLQKRLVNAVNGCMNGVIRMSNDMEGLVETSSNLAIVKCEEDKIAVHCLLRSSVDSAKEALSNAIGSVFELAGAEVVFEGGYPGWKPNMQSEILKTMQETYRKMTGKVPEIKAIHAGLECGLLGGVYPHWDMISFGPTIRYPHSPDEKVNIESVQKFYKWMVETLKDIPVK